jgi:flagellin
VLTINTHPGAMIALQNLNQTHRDLMQGQDRIATGLKVASARDNGGVYAIAQGMRSELGGLRAVQQSLDRAVTAVDIAIVGGEAIQDLLIEMKGIALAATDTSLDLAAITSLNEDFKALRDQINTVVSSAEFNRVNILDWPPPPPLPPGFPPPPPGSPIGLPPAGSVAFTAMTGAGENQVIEIRHENMRFSLNSTHDNGLIKLDPTWDFLNFSVGPMFLVGGSGTNTERAAFIANRLDQSIIEVGKGLSRLGAVSKRLEIQNTFTGKLSDTLETGIGNLVDADMARESARVQALQVKQQLGLQTLSIANTAPGAILGLFEQRRTSRAEQR